MSADNGFVHPRACQTKERERVGAQPARAQFPHLQQLKGKPVDDESKARLCPKKAGEVSA
jgi:hypothetical protein